ncbi:hypothetical protein PV08_04034 [Exophiala spinifera]|uniref:Bromo domain-containing protein n=1 Tax=Exophiala spinifera TaxID=91928 RepID=A0A0D2BZR4_9EURO|nr:uncharacterized protein PV08_04034 [Exophiala spinifera]KIW16844.1 hypothetical protein PV08_04034 [Exophiala spinifera]
MEAMEGFCGTCNIRIPKAQGTYCCFCGSRLFTRPAGPQRIGQSQVVTPPDIKARDPTQRNIVNAPPPGLAQTNDSREPRAALEHDRSASYSKERDDHAESESDSDHVLDIVKLFHPSAGSVQSTRPNLKKEERRQVQRTAQGRRRRRRTVVTHNRKPGTATDNIVTTAGYESDSSTIEVVRTTRAPRRSTRVANSLTTQQSDDDRLTRATRKRRRKNSDENEAVLIPRHEFGGLSQDDTITPARLRTMKWVIGHLQNASFSDPFREPVDSVSVPTYSEEIKKPMDLGEIARKLANQQYDTVSAFIDDFELIISNCITFNGTGSWVTDYARMMERVFVERMRSLPWAHEISLP